MRDLDRALKTDPGAIGKTRWYQDLDHARTMSSSADDLARTATRVERSSKTLPLKAGGALAAAGILWDIHSGKDPTQAVASGAGGFLASVGAGAATGAIVGSFVPIPGVGTAAGAIIGAGVGIFTSGAIDSLFENGPDVGEAAEAGWDAVRGHRRRHRGRRRSRGRCHRRAVRLARALPPRTASDQHDHQ